MKALPVEAARRMLHAGGEIAFLDVREHGQYGESHPLFVVNAPYSRLELIVPLLVPRLAAPLLLIDAGDGVSDRAAARLEAMGYADVSTVAGGVPAWSQAGFPLYKGVNVPSKTLGELAETVWHPRMIAAEELADWRESGRDFAFYDTRPPAEYAKMRVPGAVCLPNGELAHRFAAVPQDRPVVVTCAGRTRGIVGAVGMQLLGAGDRVLALENGTQGWALSGQPLERGNAVQPFPDLDAAQLAQSRARADALIRRFALPEATAAEAAEMLADPSRTGYLLDVRSTPETQGDPVPAADHAPGVQLVQATDQWVGVRHSRILVCCDTGLRSALAAFWLRQLGYDAIVVRIDDTLRALPAPSRPAAPQPGEDIPTIPAAEALEHVAAGARLLDLRPSQDYRAGHAAGALWAIRPRLPAASALGEEGAVLLAATQAEAGLAALDLSEAGVRGLRILQGGHAALVEAGAQVEATPASPPDPECIDFLFFVHDRHDGNLDSSRRYLEWETGLIAQLDAAERAEFRLFQP